MITEQTVFDPVTVDPMSPLTGDGRPYDRADSPFTSISAFIAASQVFFTAMQEALFHESCDCSPKRAPEARLCRLQTLLEKLQYMLGDLPAVMRQWVVAELGHQSRDEFDKNVDSPEVAHAQLEITRANLHFTHLWLQNYILEKIDLILQQQVSDASVTSDTASASAALRANWASREDICRQMLHLLHSISASTY